MISGGFDHYEISNFARKEKLSAHNMVYWTGANYMGFGPAAHSYNGNTRSWNISSLKDYMNGINNRVGVREFENLTMEEKYHDYLITTLRTKWGCSLEVLQQKFKYPLDFKSKIFALINAQLIYESKDKIYLTRKGKFVADSIIQDLFWV